MAYVPKSQPGAIIVHESDVPWTSFPMPGTDFKLLHLDEANAGATYLLKVGAGESSVLHKHLGGVEVYTVSGGGGTRRARCGPAATPSNPTG